MSEILIVTEDDISSDVNPNAEIVEVQPGPGDDYIIDLQSELKRPTASATSTAQKETTDDQKVSSNIFDGPEIKVEENGSVNTVIKNIINNKGIIASMSVMAIEGLMAYSFPRMYKNMLFKEDDILMIRTLKTEFDTLSAAENKEVELLKSTESKLARELRRYNDNIEKFNTYCTKTVPLSNEERQILIEFINSKMSSSQLLTFFEKYPTLAIGAYIAIPRIVPMGTDLLVQKMGNISVPEID